MDRTQKQAQSTWEYMSNVPILQDRYSFMREWIFDALCLRHLHRFG